MNRLALQGFPHHGIRRKHYHTRRDAPTDRADEIRVDHEDDARNHRDAIRPFLAVHKETHAHEADENIPIQHADGNEEHGAFVAE